MAVSLDPAASPDTAEEAIAVVDGVLAASPADELDWIEWKGSLDLSSKAVRGTLARHILGMANRMPETAASHAGGRGFMVVGAEPGDRRGVTAADPAGPRPHHPAAHNTGPVPGYPTRCWGSWNNPDYAERLSLSLTTQSGPNSDSVQLLGIIRRSA
jgi:hypothetical protein